MTKPDKPGRRRDSSIRRHAGSAGLGQICVLGLGTMGSAIASRLRSAGWVVCGRDTDPAAERRAGGAGVRTANDDDIRHADVVISCLPADEAVVQALTGPSGLLSLMRRGSTLVETSTILPATIRAIQSVASAAGIQVIDCGLSGGPAEASTGTVTLLVGGSPETIGAAEQILAHLGSIVRAGEVGDAKAIKLVNNVMSIGNVVIAAEAFNLGLQAGISGPRLMEVLSTTGGRSHQFLKRFPMLLEGDFKPRFALALGLKDVRLAMRLGEQLGLRLETAAAIAGRLEQAVEAGLGMEDLVAVAKLGETAEAPRGSAS